MDSNEVRIPIPKARFFVIYNTKEKAWHNGGFKGFVFAKKIDNAKFYGSLGAAESVIRKIAEKSEIGDYFVVEYKAEGIRAHAVEG